MIRHGPIQVANTGLRLYCQMLNNNNVWLINTIIYFDIFDNFWSISISFWFKLIDFKLFDIIGTCFNPFRRDNLTSGLEFGSKMLIKRWLDHDITRFGDLDWLDRLDLVQLNWRKCYISQLPESVIWVCACVRPKFIFTVLISC